MLLIMNGGIILIISITCFLILMLYAIKLIYDSWQIEKKFKKLSKKKKNTDRKTS